MKTFLDLQIERWKPVLFVVLFVALNSLSFLLSLAILLMHLNLYTGQEQDPLGLIAIFPSAIVFVVIGVTLLVLGERFRISILNKLLPFMAGLGFLMALPFESGYQTGPKFLFGLSIGVVVCLLTAATTVQTLISQRKGSSKSSKEN